MEEYMESGKKYSTIGEFKKKERRMSRTNENSIKVFLADLI